MVRVVSIDPGRIALNCTICHRILAIKAASER